MSAPVRPAAAGRLLGDDARESGRRRRLVVWSLLASLVIGGIALVSLPLAPVERTTAVVDWPSPGTPVESTMLPLVPYRPLGMAVDVPCTSAPAIGGRVLFSTFPIWPLSKGQGLTVSAVGRVLTVKSEGTVVWTGAVSAGECLARIEVDGEQTRVLVNGFVVADAPIEPPRIASLATSLPEDQTSGLSARVELDSRFETSPTLLKRVLIGVSLLAAVVAVAALARLDRFGAVRSRPAAVAVRRWPQDLLVLTGLVVWLVVGPTMSDDGYIVAVAEGSAETGFLGNYYHWYNAPEAPFSLVHMALTPLVELSRAPIVLRLPGLVAGLTVWLLLTRVVLARLTDRTRLPAATWLAVPVFLAWWLPFDSTLRPEPWVALGCAVALSCVLLYLEQRRVLLLAAAVAAVALSVALAPAGLMAGAPLVLLAPRIWMLLRSLPVTPWLVVPALFLPAAVLAGFAVFADQPLAAVLEATRMHDVIGPSVDWWDEIVRYRFLFADSGEMGNFARRTVVLGTLLCLGLALAMRRALRAAPGGLLLTVAQCFGLALVVLVLAPSKWTHHFGDTVAFAVPLVVGTVLHLPAGLLRERSAAVLTTVLTVLAAGAVAAGFAAPNTWAGYGSLELDPQLPAALAHPLTWLVVAGLVVTVGAVRARAGRRAAFAAVPGTIIVLALGTSVVAMVGTQVAAAGTLHPAWSMAGQNVRHLTGSTCGMGDDMEVLVPEPLAAWSREEAQTEPGAFASGGGSFLPRPASLGASARYWGSFGTQPGSPEAVTGTLTTPWFVLPDRVADDRLGVVVAGRSGGENSVVVEFADRDAPDRVVARTTLGPADGPRWRQSRPELPDGVPGDLVRVVATDGSTSPGGWLSVSQPVVYEPTSLPELADGRAVHVDFPLRLAFPCLPPVTVAHGLAQAPDIFLAVAPRAGPETASGLAADENLGGTLAMASQASAQETLETRLPFVSDEAFLRGQDLGTVVLWSYPLPRDRFRLSFGKDVVPGWQWGYRYPIPIPVEPLELPGPRLVDKGPQPAQVDTRPGVQPQFPARP